jgi:hypothetical protein
VDSFQEFADTLHRGLPVHFLRFGKQLA